MGWGEMAMLQVRITARTANHLICFLSHCSKRTMGRVYREVKLNLQRRVPLMTEHQNYFLTSTDRKARKRRLRTWFMTKTTTSWTILIFSSSVRQGHKTIT